MVERTIAALCKRSDDNAREKGWYDGEEKDPRPFSLHAALVHSELSEALEEWRDHRKLGETYFEASPVDSANHAAEQILAASELENHKKNWQAANVLYDYKPVGIPIEMADVVIRICQRTAGDGALLQREFEELARSLSTVSSFRWKKEDLPCLIADVHAAVSMAYLCEVNSRWGAMMNREGLPSSAMGWLANALYLVFEFCKQNELDLWGAIEMKEAFNRARSVRHGGKAG
jgi:hypothetical protein